MHSDIEAKCLMCFAISTAIAIAFAMYLCVAEWECELVE